jgi:hypothetical protein
MRIGLAFAWLLLAAAPALAQVPPSADERAHYAGLFAASARNDAATITRLAASGAAVDARRSWADAAARRRVRESPRAMRALVKAGANPNALERPLRHRDDRRRRRRCAHARRVARARRQRRQRDEPLRRNRTDRSGTPRPRRRRAHTRARRARRSITSATSAGPR